MEGADESTELWRNPFISFYPKYIEILLFYFGYLHDFVLEGIGTQEFRFCLGRGFDAG